MARFRFRLEQVLDYRRQLEEQALQAFAEATLARDETVRRIELMQEDHAVQTERLGNAALLRSEEIWLIQGYVKTLLMDIKIANILLADQEEALVAARENLIERAKERELLDKLKEKQAARHAHEERMAEQREYDETATLRFKNVAV